VDGEARADGGHTARNHAYLRARYYDPSTAQFMSLDPMVDSTMSPYAYVSGDPLNTIDPSGNAALHSCGLAVGQNCDAGSSLGNWSTLCQGVSGVLRNPDVSHAVGGLGDALGGAAAGASGVIAGWNDYQQGNSVGHAIGVGVGTTVGTYAGAAFGAAACSELGPVAIACGAAGGLVGGYVGGAVGGAVGGGVEDTIDSIGNKISSWL
jgi:RHS repeat-associated protein